MTTLCSCDFLEKYGATYALALIYFPEELHDKMIKLNDDILSYSWDDALKKFTDLTPLIRMQLQKL